MEGRIVIYWPHRRFGFIAQNDFPEDLFFHLKDLIPTGIEPAEGRNVTFEHGRFRGKPKAVNVRILPDPDPSGGTRSPHAWISDDGGAE